MSVQIFNTREVQDLLRLASGLDQPGGNPRVKEIVHRVICDLYRTIEDLNITSDEYWAAIAYLNRLGERGEAGLLSPGLGFDRYLDMRMDAEDAALGIGNERTPRTIEGPLYVAGAPVSNGFARLDDGSDEAGHTLIMHGTVRGADGQPLPGAQVEVWHANTKGYGCPPDGPTQGLLNELGRHGNRPAHIHFFVTADGHRKLTTQINIDGDPLVYDDFAYATREGLVPPLVEQTDQARIEAEGLDGPFAEIVFDISLTELVDGVDNQIVNRPRLAA